jgi:hypothetical protein
MMNDDPWDDALMPPIREPSEQLRESLRDRTVGVVRRRRYRRIALRVVVALAVQGAIAGILVAALLGFRSAARRGEAVAIVQEQPAQEILEHRPKVNDPTPKPVLAAVALEWQAFDAPPEQQPALYFEAGQRYFDHDKDLESALRCYRQAFDAGPKELLTVSSTDNWLVMAIKIDCRKEN